MQICKEWKTSKSDGVKSEGFSENNLVLEKKMKNRGYFLKKNGSMIRFIEKENLKNSWGFSI